MPPEKPKHSYTRTFPTIYNYLRNYYAGDEEDIKSESPEEKKAEDAATHVIAQQAVAATSGEATTALSDPHKPVRKSSLTNRLLDKLHVDVSYLYGTAMDSPDSVDSDPLKSASSKPKTPLSAKILSPHKAASISSKITTKLRNIKNDNKEDKSDSKNDNNSGNLSDDDDYDDDESKEKDKDNEVLKTPLEMFHERLELLKEGLPDDLFHTFTDAKEVEDDPAIKAALKYKE